MKRVALVNGVRSKIFVEPVSAEDDSSDSGDPCPCCGDPPDNSGPDHDDHN